MKDSLKDIQVDDVVIVSTTYGLSLEKVTKRVPTQIHLKNKKYRLTGSEISSDKWHFTNIYAPLSKPHLSEETWLDIYKKQQVKLREEKEVLITQIQTFDLSKVSISKLKSILKELS